MHWINNIALPPNQAHLMVNRYLLLSAEFVCLVFLSLLAGALFWSIWFSVLYQNTEKPGYRALSKYLIDVAAINKLVVLGFGLLPLLTLVLLFAQAMLDTTSPGPFNPESLSQIATAGLVASIPFVAAGLVLVILYQASFATRERNFRYHILVGVSALGALMLGMLIISCSLALAVDPEKWLVINNFAEFVIFSWSPIVRFMLMGPLSWAIIGTAAMFAYRNLPDITKPTEDVGELVRQFGSGLTLGTALVLPVLLFWHLNILPGVASSVSLHLALAAGIAALLFAAHSAYKMLVYGHFEFAGRAFLMVMVFVLALSWGDLLARHNALRDHEALLVSRAVAGDLERAAEREARMSVTETADPEVGAEVYTRLCTACHTFDKKVVGPPYNAVLPKYEGKIDQLKAFIANPHKVDPAYPPMPKQGLKANEVASVAAYLMQEYEKGKK